MQTPGLLVSSCDAAGCPTFCNLDSCRDSNSVGGLRYWKYYHNTGMDSFLEEKQNRKLIMNNRMQKKMGPTSYLVKFGICKQYTSY